MNDNVKGRTTMFDICDYNTALEFLREKLIGQFCLIMVILGFFLLIWLMLKYPIYDKQFIEMLFLYIDASGAGDEKLKRKYSRKLRNYRGDLKGLLIAGAVCGLLMLMYTVPLMLDVYTGSVFVYEGEYTIDEVYYSHVSYYAVVTIDGDEHKLQLHDMMKRPTEDEYSGVIIYSKYATCATIARTFGVWFEFFLKYCVTRFLRIFALPTYMTSLSLLYIK